MQVDRVLHHRVVDQHDAHALAVVEADRFGLGEADAVETPDVALHVAGQVQFDGARRLARVGVVERRSEEHTSELQSLMRISYAVVCLTKKNTTIPTSTY